MGTEGISEADVVVVGGGPGGSTAGRPWSPCRATGSLLLEKEKFPALPDRRVAAPRHGARHLPPDRRGGRSSPRPASPGSAAGPSALGRQPRAVDVRVLGLAEVGRARRRTPTRSSGASSTRSCSTTRASWASRCGRTARSPTFSGRRQRVRGCRYTGADGEHRTNPREVRGGRLRQQEPPLPASRGTRQYSEFFRNLALFGYFEGGKRLPAANSGNILSCAFDSGWFWYIPLSPTLTSVGAVVRRELAEQDPGRPGSRPCRALIDECPLISDYLRDAKRVTDGQYGQLRVRKDYSYHNTRVLAPGHGARRRRGLLRRPGVLLRRAPGDLQRAAGRAVDQQRAGGDGRRGGRVRGVRAALPAGVRRLLRVPDVVLRPARQRGLLLLVGQEGHQEPPSSELESFVELVGGVSSGEAALAAAEAAGRSASRASPRSSRARSTQLVANKRAEHGPALQVLGRQAGDAGGRQGTDHVPCSARTPDRRPRFSRAGWSPRPTA